MGLYLAIFDDDEEIEGVEIGLYSDFNYFRDIVANELEDGKAGSKYPTLNLHSDCDGTWSVEESIKLPGVGYKVAGCVVVYAFNKQEAIPVDTHVAVISHRLGWTNFDNPDKIMFDLMKKIPKKYWLLVNELLVVHGREICYKRNPKCYKCPIVKYCKYKDKNL